MTEEIKELTNNLLKKLDTIKDKKIIVIGDVCLDEYITGVVTRISPEAPVPVLEYDNQSFRPGMAANVAVNVIKLGGKAFLFSAVGNDDTAAKLDGYLPADMPLDFVRLYNRPTTKKTRFMSGHHLLMRLDRESSEMISLEQLHWIKDSFPKALETADAVIVQDYGKGLLNLETLEHIFKMCNEKKVPVFVDPCKTTPLWFYEKATVIMPNHEEAKKLICDFNTVEQLGFNLLGNNDIQHSVITLGKDGMHLSSKEDRSSFTMPTFAQKVFDVTGAGDTAIAALALGYVSGMTMKEACVFANLAAGVVVGKIGSATCTKEELLEFAEKLGFT